MASEQEQILEPPVPMSMPTSEEIRQIAFSQVVRNVLAVRSVLLPFGAIALTLLVLFDPSVLKLCVLGVMVLFNVVVAVSDRRRIKRATQLDKLDLVVIVALQTGVIFLTGGIESPVLPAFVVGGFAAGIALGWQPAKVILLLIFVILWSAIAAGLLGWLPRTLPSFFGLEHGFITDTSYVLTKGVFVTLITFLTARVGARVNESINKMVVTAIEARQQALETLQDRNQELVHLSAAIAHELKNPLASIQGLAQLLERGGSNAERRFEVLHQEIARMKTTLDSFLNLSRPLGELTLAKVSSADLLDELTTLHEGMALAKSITVLPGEDALDAIACDPRKMKQALTNLLQNAIEATPAGGRITWIARKNESTVAIGVEDSGPGIPRELIDKASNVGVTTKAGGSGIGLAVARSIAEQHGGKLVLENHARGGLSAYLELPR